MKNGVKWRLKKLSPKMTRLQERISNTGAEPYALKMWDKGAALAFELYNVPSVVANIIKQDALASGIDAAVNRGVINCSVTSSDIVIVGSVRGLNGFITRLQRQVFGLPLLAKEIQRLMDEERGATARTLRANGKELSLASAQVMGILNCTPDSFSDGGKYATFDDQRARVDEIISAGASFVDIGGVTTKPAVQRAELEIPSVQEELDRVMPAVEYAVSATRGTNVFVSADTFRGDVAKELVAAGIDMINDQGGGGDNGIVECCANSELLLCIMGCGGERDIVDFCIDRPNELIGRGVSADKIILDVGFGFSKSLNEEYKLLHYLAELCNLDYPMLVGVSRKSMIKSVVGNEPVQNGAGTLAAEVFAVISGADIIRTHNVASCVSALKVSELILNS